MSGILRSILISATLLGTCANGALAFGFEPPVHQCVVDTQNDCFDVLFSEFNKRSAALSDPAQRDGYIAVSGAMLLKVGQLAQAEVIANEVQNPNMRNELLAHIGAAFAKDNRITEALRILEMIRDPYRRAILIAEIGAVELRSADIETTLPPLIRQVSAEFVDPTLSEIAFALVETDHLQKAGSIASLIFDQKLQGQVLSYVARGFANEGDVLQATAHLRRIADPDIQALGWGEIGFTLHENGYEDAALRVFNDAVTLVMKTAVSDPALDDRLETIAHYLIMAGHGENALRVIDEIRKPQIKAHLLSRLGAAYVDASAFESASEHLDRAVGLASGEHDRYEFNSTIRSAAISYARLGDMETALSVARLSDEPNIVAGTIKSIGDIALQAGDVGLAEEIYRSIEHIEIRTAAFIELAKELRNAGKGSEATALLTDLETVLVRSPVNFDRFQDGIHLRASAIGSLARAYVDARELAEGIRVGSLIEDTNQRLWTLAPVVGLAMAKAETELADDLSARLFSEVESHPHPGDVLSVIVMITTLAPNLQNLELQKRYASLLDNDDSRSHLFSVIFETQTLTEHYTAAEQLLELIPNPEMRAIAVIELLKRRIQLITNIR